MVSKPLHPLSPIPTFKEINDLHEATGYAERTDLASFHVFSLDHGCETVRSVMPPHRRQFYQATLLRAADGVSVALDTSPQVANQHLLVFAAPRQVVSWTRSEAQSGWVLYFKGAFIGQTEAHIEQQFTFFQPGEVNIQAIPDTLLMRLQGYCEQMRHAFDERHAYRLDVLRGLLTTFLYECLALYGSGAHPLSGRSASEAILWRFRHLLERNFHTHKTVAAYAKLMRITPGHLSEVVSGETGESASMLIGERILYEAKQLLAHSELSIAEVSTHLLFSEPTHFARFFKRMSGITPRQFRESGHFRHDRG